MVILSKLLLLFDELSHDGAGPSYPEIPTKIFGEHPNLGRIDNCPISLQEAEAFCME